MGQIQFTSEITRGVKMKEKDKSTDRQMGACNIIIEPRNKRFAEYEAIKFEVEDLLINYTNDLSYMRLEATTIKNFIVIGKNDKKRSKNEKN